MAASSQATEDSVAANQKMNAHTMADTAVGASPASIISAARARAGISSCRARPLIAKVHSPIAAASANDVANVPSKVILVGYGASAAALAGGASGAWYGDVAQAPASEGRLAMQALIQALRTGKNGGGIDPVAGLPDQGIVTKANVSQFTAEWPG